jgi:hypothetical protein
MNGRTLGNRLLVCFVLLAGGCGTVPDVIVDTAREAAKEAIEREIEEALNDLAEELLDLDGLSLPLGIGDESDTDVDGES